MDPRLYPGGAQPFPPADIDTTPTGTDLVEVRRGNTNTRKAISEYDLLTGVVRQVRVRATVAEINGAGGKVVVPAVSGYKVRIVDAALIAIGGAAAGGTSVDLVATQGASEVRPLVCAVAGLTQNTLLRAGAANAAILAAGASFVANDAGTGISVAKQSGGSNITTLTHVDVLLKYVLER